MKIKYVLRNLTRYGSLRSEENGSVTIILGTLGNIQIKNPQFFFLNDRIIIEGFRKMENKTNYFAYDRIVVYPVLE